MASEQELSLWIRLKDDATKGLQNIKAALSDTDRATSASSAIAGVLAKGLAVAGTGVIALGSMALKAAADAEQTTIAFTGMLGSAEKAKNFMAQLADFAKKTPFDLPQVEQATKRIMAYGIAEKDVMGDMTLLGNIASKIGTDKLPFLITAFGQVHAKTVLSGEELKQFTETGINLIPKLAEVTGLSVGDIVNDTKKLGITFDQVREALTRTVNGDEMAKMSLSLSGQISNLGDAWKAFLRLEGAQLIEWAKIVVVELTKLVLFLPTLIDWIKQASTWLGDHKIYLVLVAGAITGALIPALLALIPTVLASATAFGTAAVALAPFIIGGALIAALGYGIYQLVTHWDLVKKKVAETWDAVYTKHKTVFDAIIAIVKTFISIVSPIFSVFMDAMKALWDLGWDGIKDKAVSIWDSIKDAIVGSINWLIEKINSFVRLVNKAISGAAGWAGASTNTISEIPKLANGGIVNSPTLAMIGEAGPEAVVPLNKMNGGGFGGMTIIINGDVTGEEAVQKLGDMLVRRLQLSTAIV